MATKTPTPTAPELELLNVDPATLGVRDQARADATPDDELVASVRKYGVMQPPTVEYDEEQQRHVIVMGHRRVGAAIAAGLDQITVLVRTAALDDDAIKLEQQIVENERRKALTTAELAQGYQKLALFGKTPEDIAAELAEKPERIRAGLKVATANPIAAEILEGQDLDLEQAAIITDFADRPALAKELAYTAVTRPQDFAWKVEAERKKDRDRADKNRLVDEHKTAGIPIVKSHGEAGTWWTGDDNLGKALTMLVDGNGDPITAEDHATCPGHAVIINDGRGYGTTPDYVCTSWAQNGHHDKHQWQWRRNQETIDPQEQAAREQREREAEERDRAKAEDRARRIANNTARRTAIRGILAGRLNQTAGIFDLIAEALSFSLNAEAWPDGAIALEILTGDPHGGGYQTDQLYAAEILAGRFAPLRIVVANAFALLEEAVRSSHPAAIKYYAHLTTWGYQLSEIDTENLTQAHTALAEGIDGGSIDESDDEEDDE